MEDISEITKLIISNFNKANYLEKCLDSCISQDFQNIEIIFWFHH